MLLLLQVETFPPEVEVRAVIEGQLFGRLMYAKKSKLPLGKLIFIYSFQLWIVCTILHKCLCHNDINSHAPTETKVMYMYLCFWVTFHVCCHLMTVGCWLFSNLPFFKEKLSETLSECQTVWIKTRTQVSNDQGPNCLQRLSADEKSYRWQICLTRQFM